MKPNSRQQLPCRARIGANTTVEPGATVGLQYHRDAGEAVIGANGIIRSGSVIYGDVVAGDCFQTGHNAVVRAKVRLGDYCCIFHNTTVEGLVRIGRGVRVMAHVYIPSRTWFGDMVFVGPGVTFLNDRSAARYTSLTESRIRGATVEDSASIGGGATILPGVRIGARSFIAAGAVVTKDVPPDTLAVGVPAVHRPLPEALQGSNAEDVCIQPKDIWHPDLDSLDDLDWPDDWPEAWD